MTVVIAASLLSSQAHQHRKPQARGGCVAHRQAHGWFISHGGDTNTSFFVMLYIASGLLIIKAV